MAYSMKMEKLNILMVSFLTELLYRARNTLVDTHTLMVAITMECLRTTCRTEQESFIGPMV